MLLSGYSINTFFKLNILFGAISLFAACTDDLPPAVADAYASLPDKLDYNFHVKPILSDKCFACHGPDAESRYADLRLDLPASSPLLSSTEASTRGRALNGELLERILSSDPEQVMPPPESKLSLSDRERATLAKWLEQGAPYAEHWSFLARQEIQAPTGEGQEIDRFLNARLAQEVLSPNVPASPDILIRRAAFALTGLPPEPQDYALSYETLLDTLLARPAYGERMAAHWLDVARYADSDGYLDDKHRRLWPYRDWVIRAFNQNLAYDDFITQQLAGDLLPDANQETTLATAFNRLHKRNSEAGIVYEEYRVEYVADRTLTLGKALLGLSIECAQCHDHKYDPISQEDYFKTFAFFNSTAEIGTAVYGPDQTPGPSLLLSDERRDSIISFLREQIAKEEADLPIREQDPDLAEAEVYLPFDQVVQTVDHSFSSPLYGSETSSVSIQRDKFAQGRSGQALFYQDGTDLILPDSIGWHERHEPFSLGFSVRVDSSYEEAGLLMHCEVERLGTKGWSVHLENNHLRFLLAHSWPSNAIEVRTPKQLALHEWTDFVITYDGSSKATGVKMFRNGRQIEPIIVHDNL
ncbi:MAG: DUF1549 domain-containing protein, partial [Bacteroidota bacterium]